MFNRVIRLITLLAAVLAVTLIIIAPANAADIRKGEKLVVPAGEVVNDDLYLFGSGITVDGTVNGDVIAFGENIVIIGIPLGLAGLALYALAVYLGHIFTGLFIGKWMLRQHTGTALFGPLVGALALGLLVVYVIAVIPVIGCLSDLAAILFGLGAICLLIKTKLGGSAAA